MGRWDLYLKSLVRENPQDFVSWLLPGARYIRMREGQFQTLESPQGSFPTREIRSDCMIEVEYEGQRLLMHVEFQSTKDDLIGERLLGYNYEATRLHKLPVYSWVIYPRHVFEPPLSPYEWKVPSKGQTLRFLYDSIELAEMPLEELQQKQFLGLAPLLVCTTGGATREVLERAIEQLEAAYRPEGLAIVRLIALLVFEKRADDLAWIQWRFATMHDFLLENSIMYQELVREGELKGELKGELRGELKGELKGIRQSIEAVVQTRFPALVDLAKERIGQIQNQEILRNLLVAMSAASTERKARRYLLALHEDQGQ